MGEDVTMTNQIHCGDCLEVLATLEENSVDTVITDPPYGLDFMGKDWDHGIPGPRFWKEIARVAKPGAMLLAFGGTRTHHRLMCAIEDAGWEIRDCLMWLYGSGFPKSHDISKAIDKLAGAEREVIGERPIAYPDSACWGIPNKAGIDNTGMFQQGAVNEGGTRTITAPATPAAKLWDGWGTALAPSWEPIILAMNPPEGTFAENALKHGVAGLWVDGGRIALQDGESTYAKPHTKPGEKGSGGWKNTSQATGSMTDDWKKGRWPKNCILSHSPECRRVGTKRVKSQNPQYRRKQDDIQREPTSINMPAPEPGRGFGYADPDGQEQVEAWECVEGCAVRILSEQSGESKSTAAGRKGSSGFATGYDGDYTVPYGDKGTAARFFYCAKAPRSERWFYCKLCAKAFPMAERDQHNHDGSRKHIVMHPTQKPLELMRYLVRLTRTPTGGAVLDPFAGSFSTGVACILEGRDFIGIEIDEHYVEIALARIAAAQPRLL